MRKFTALLLMLTLAACSGSNGGGVAAPQQVDFQQFVQEQVAATADDADPVELDDIVFLNLFQENPGFSNLLN